MLTSNAIFISGPDDKSIYVDSNTRIQILETMMDLPTAEKEQNAAFIVSTVCDTGRSVSAVARRRYWVQVEAKDMLKFERVQ